ncbi:carboxypeptidase-like regulatory domain-containing protein [Bernardetia sp. OM2101]|uniref:carboxypeptidase-like regulatory domain-containing protein n=1 Tax=Bernardetia sp. OM2101 TaxID=3344876 RepID=UPI0035D06F06
MKKSILFMLLLFSICYSVFGQISVKGKIVDALGRPILRPVAIKNSDSTYSTTTNTGSFEIEVKSKNDSLIFSSAGRDSQKFIANKIINDSTITLKSRNVCTYRGVGVVRVVYVSPLKINSWNGIFYNPYGIIISKGFYLNKEQENRTYFLFRAGYSTNFKNNVDFYGSAGTDLLGQHIYYTFQQTTINKAETESSITTHLLESSSGVKYFGIMYGIGYQQFQRKGIENNLKKNWGANIGIAKSIKYVGTLYFKSLYWQDYWAWDIRLNKKFRYKRRLRFNTDINYRQTTQNFKEVNLTLGYIF